jgi:DNA-binding XRE family transcriptional regulator
MPRHSFTGRRPDHERRREIFALGAQGLTRRAIGRRLNVSRQSVHQVLARCHDRTSPVGVQGPKCGTEITRRSALTHNDLQILYLACLGRLPEAGLGQRLQSHRVAADLTQGDLAKQVGVHPRTLLSYEQGATAPAGRTLTKSARVLGLGVLV